MSDYRVRPSFKKQNDNNKSSNEKQNDNNRSSNAGSRLGFFGLLTIVLIALKLTGLTTISWWWVFSPFLIPVGLWIVLFVIVFVWLWYKA